MLHLHQSNRLEHLANALVDRFDVPTGRHPLELEQVVVQSPGMATWLRHRWAERTGVAAAVAFPLPAVLVWRVIRALVPDVPERSPYEKQAMAWRLLPLLGPELLAEPAFAPVARYLDDDATGLKRWQLAQRVADLFDQYLVYRPDWMARWRADPEGAAAALGDAQGWQPRLWGRLIEACQGAPDRAALQDRALARLAEEPEAAGAALAAALPPRLGLFGLSALPPAQLRLVVALAEHVEVHLYRLEPSREYWGDVVSGRQRARRVAEETARGEDRGASLLETGHPLLGALGRAGRDFVDLLLEASDAPLEDTGFETPVGDALLPRLQRDVLELADAGSGQARLPAGDDSLLFVDCHGPLREVEVLHDWLLGRFEADPSLTPRDVVVMIPDIDGYAPCVEAVFGSGAEGDGEAVAARLIPFGIADRGARVESPVLEAVAALLRLPRSRLAASELLGILETPAVLRAFGLDEAGLEQLVHWIDAAGVRWGRDGAHWRSLGFPAAAPPDGPLPNTWAFGIERLLLGYAMGDEAGTFAGSLPLGGVEGGAVEALGALLEFLRAVDTFTERLAGPHAPSAWARHLSALLETFLAPDVDEELALGGVRELLARLVEAEERFGVTEPLSAAVIEAALEPVLRAPAGAHRFLGGGVTFCTLLPMRAIPFRVVCLLGMNEGAYPRRETPLGFDLLAAAPRRGDRARRLEDRYLFLEAILSAREHLYVSWTGRSAHDDSVQPPSVVVSELRDVLAGRFVAASGGAVLDAITLRHPLQPFSPRYGSEAGLPPTYSELWTREDGAAEPGAPAALPPFEETEPPPLRALVGFFLDPCGSFLAERLGVRFGPEAVAAEDDEPFLLEGLERHRVRSEALQALRRGEAVDTWAARERLAGRLPHGAAADAVLEEARARLEGLRERLGARLAEPAETVVAEVPLADGVLAGEVPDCQRDLRLVLRPGTAKARDLMRLWLEHLALAGAGAGRRSALVDDREIRLLPVVDAAEARAELDALVDLRRTLLSEPGPLFVDGSFEYARRFLRGKQAGDSAVALAAARGTWRRRWGDVPGEGERPAVARLWPAWPGDEDPERFAELALAVWGPLLERLEQGRDADLAPEAADG